MADETQPAKRHVVVMAAFEAQTDLPLLAGDRVRLSELGDPELAVASNATADETGDLVMLADPKRVPETAVEQARQRREPG